METSSITRCFHANVKQFVCKIGIKFNNISLVIGQNNFTTKILNAYIVSDIDNWPKILLGNFTLKNCLFGATNIAKNSDKSKWVYSGYGVAFDGKGKWNFGNNSAGNVVIFGAGNSLSSHTNNCQVNFLLLSEGVTSGINESSGATKKNLVLFLVKKRRNFD